MKVVMKTGQRESAEGRSFMMDNGSLKEIGEKTELQKLKMCDKEEQQSEEK